MNNPLMLGQVNIDNWAANFYRELRESFGQRFEIEDLKSELCVVYGKCAENASEFDDERMAKRFTIAAQNYLRNCKRKIVNGLKSGERSNVLPYPDDDDADGNGIDIYELKRMYLARTEGADGDEYTYSINDLARRFKVERHVIVKLLKRFPRRS